MHAPKHHHITTHPHMHTFIHIYTAMCTETGTKQGRQAGLKTGRQATPQTDRGRDRHADTCTYIYSGIRSHAQISVQVHGLLDTHAYKQTRRHIQTHIHTHRHKYTPSHTLFIQIESPRSCEFRTAGPHRPAPPVGSFLAAALRRRCSCRHCLHACGRSLPPRLLTGWAGPPWLAFGRQLAQHAVHNLAGYSWNCSF